MIVLRKKPFCTRPKPHSAPNILTNTAKTKRNPFCSTSRNATRVTAGVTACGQRRPVRSTRSLKQVSPGRREDPDTQQPGRAKRTSRCQEEHLTRTARWTEATSTAKQQKSSSAVGDVTWSSSPGNDKSNLNVLCPLYSFIEDWNL
ncbi:hypothetical protein ElyMa_000987600 [Elysia marginata]|uniref:Uncharacterized protein n=1 Tax=Elysia marginata TaxID=1093978 RepID=A0AAV4HIJ2_9GAST|nr:hypothetical protein ElyMa_000987600 [Elysia marginata]